MKVQHLNRLLIVLTEAVPKTNMITQIPIQVLPKLIPMQASKNLMIINFPIECRQTQLDERAQFFKRPIS